MPLSIAIQNSEIVGNNNQSAAASPANVAGRNDVNIEVEEDEEEEDVDFNPFLREEISSEASSGLSSENECPGGSIEENLQNSAHCNDVSASPHPPDDIKGYNFESVDGDEETVMQTRLDAISGHPNNFNPTSPMYQGESLICSLGGNKLLSSGDGGHAADELTKEESLMRTESSFNPRNSHKPIAQIDDEDAICRRTRARHSLVDYSLEELETFLQEPDDYDNLQNMDDAEVYQKFLSACLLNGPEDSQIGREDGNLDEDEDNDADFVIEIEEALESDVDETLDKNKGRNGKRGVTAHRPETRQKKRLKESTVNKNYLLGHTNKPVRPILPYVSNAQKASFPTPGWQFSPPERFSHCTPSQSGADLVNGFTDHQIGQLYCLMHEHVQLLIQVFSVCVLDPSRQQVATETRKMIEEMVDRREEALARRRVPYPGSCFHLQNLHNHQPVVSILDVTPLALAKSYMTDVSAIVMRYRQRQLEDVAEKSQMEKKPLFPLPTFASSAESASNIVGGITTLSPHETLSPGQQQHKKSLAATIVESTKKQSVALVPKDIAELALRFCPLFNPTLFPHKPLVPAVVNRVLFTDAEDGLLAMGIMEYNNDWMAIQRRFLPCKSEHQIFIRQKNRSSSKAPENPIKAIRRMKTSPLNADEMARIYEGLNLFKHDWISIWKYFVPHRDPSILPRQWRIATGTQKSYKKSEAFREKRRVYEAKRRQLKAPTTDAETLPEKEVGYEENMAGNMDDEDEAYVHEAFLADTEPRSSKQMPFDVTLSNINRNGAQSTNMIPQSRHQSVPIYEVATSSKPIEDSKPVYLISHAMHNAPLIASSKQLSSNSILQAPTSNSGSWSCRKGKGKGTRVVKLAPGLPPVNLPRSVRVISQSAFKTSNKGSSNPKSGDNVMRKNLHGLPEVSREGTTTSKSGYQVNECPYSDPQINSKHDERLLPNQCLAEENTSESVFYMHPLLFQAVENPSSPYLAKNCTASGTFNFFPEFPLQSESSHPRHHSSVRTHLPPSNLITIDFHPLLQRADNVHDDYTTVSSVGRLSGDPQALQSSHNNFLNASDCVLRESLVGDNELAVPTASSSHREKDPLDLDISLSSAPDNEKTTGSIDLNKHQSVEISNFGAFQYTTDSRAESVPEIVMEQEELSDSEEENPHVEFEREEMDDSEGEGLNSKQPTGIQFKELLNSSAKESGIRVIHDLNQLPPAIEEFSMEVISQDPFHTKLLKQPEKEGPKRRRSCRSSVNEPRSRPPRRALKIRLRTAGERESSASRKPRKRSPLR